MYNEGFVCSEHGMSIMKKPGIAGWMIQGDLNMVSKSAWPNPMMTVSFTVLQVWCC